MGVYAYLQPMHETAPVGEEADLDKSWFELSEGLTALGLDGEFIVTGNAPAGDEEADSDGEGTYEARIGAGEVRASWELLRAVTFEVFLAAFREKHPGADDDGYLRAHFAALVEVYRSAAEAGAGMRFMFC